MSLPEIELTVTRAAGAYTVAELCVKMPNRDITLAEQVPIALDGPALLACGRDQNAYGRKLSEMVFVPQLREAWQRALGFIEGSGQTVRLRLSLKGDDALHALRWELLFSPDKRTPLAHSERLLFSRFLSSASLADARPPLRISLRAVVAVANPPALSDQHLPPIDVAGTVDLARTGLGDIAATVLDGREGRPRATLPAIAEALRDGAGILYVVSHGSLVDGEPYLWLEREGADDEYGPIAGIELVQAISNLERRPLLVVLASCQGAGDTYSCLAAVGPALAREGVGAVLAMQGDVPASLVAQLIPKLFNELRRDGQIDRALAAARAALPPGSAWWMPVLWQSMRDGALWRSQPTGPRVPGAGVFQVPYDTNPLFRGRDAELAELARTLLDEQQETAPRTAAIGGPGGTGKTQLASEFAHRHRAEFPGGVFWLDMERPESVKTKVAMAGGPGGLELPGWAAMDFDDKLRAVRKAWAGPERRLIVFDNLDDPRLLGEWRPKGGGARVLITTRRGVWSATSAVQLIRLGPLARPASVRLLLAPRYGAQAEAVLADPGAARAAEAICELVGDLPLALALAGAYLEAAPQFTLAGYLERLARSLFSHTSMNLELEEELPTRHGQSLAATIALSFERLTTADPANARALALLRRAAHLAPAPIPGRLLTRLAAADPDDEDQAADAAGLLRRLASVGLIDLLPGESASLHRLIAAYTREQDADRAGALRAAGDALLDEIGAINDGPSPLPGVPYLAHRATLEELAHHLAPEEHARLLSRLGFLLDSLGDFTGARPCYERALELRLQALPPFHPDIAESLNNLAALLDQLGDVQQARSFYEQSLAIRERALGADHPDTAQSCNNLGALLKGQGDYAAARPYYERAIAIAERALGPAHPDTAVYLSNLGSLLHSQGDYPAARPYYERALSICEQALGVDHPDTAHSCNNLGALLKDQGELEAAQPLLKRALAICERTLGPAHPFTARCHINLGRLRRAAGDNSGARPHYERALTIQSERLGPDHPTTLLTRQELADLDAAEGAGE